LGSVVSYVSTNPAYPGSGTAHLAVCSVGTPGTGGVDALMISIDDGPFMGYFNQNVVQHGNITVFP
jgi:hypothetical protein